MEDKNKRRTLSLTIRYQPNANDPLANVVDWLKSMNSRDRRDKVEQLCLMTLLPYALESSGKTEEEIERCYWEVHERLLQHLFAMRQTLRIKASISSSSYSEKKIALEEKKEPREPSLSDFNSMFGA